MKKKKKTPKKKQLILRILFSILIVLAVSIPVILPLLRTHVRKQIENYHQETNDQGLAVEMRDNPYFASRQPGFYYSPPKVISYHSEVTGGTRHAMVFLPAGYDKDREYPVLYLIHGLHGSHRTWKNKKADVILQNLYYFQNIPEMIVVCTNNDVNKDEDTSELPVEETVKTYDKLEYDLIDSLMPYIESHYSVKKGRDYTALAGNSMGGRETLYIGFQHQDLFGHLGVFSSAGVLAGERESTLMYPLLQELKIDPAYGGFQTLMLCVGREDDVCGWVTYQLHDYMSAHNIPHIFYDVEGGHQNHVWQNALYNFCIQMHQT